MIEVTFLLEEIPHYREAFLDQLHARLNAAGVGLQVFYGRAQPSYVCGDANAPWRRRVPTRSGRIFNIDFVWQAALQEVAESRLVIVEQANRHLVNYVLHARRLLRSQKMAYWGHGRNLQSPAPAGIRERLKSTLLSRVDWWFAYSDATRDYLLAQQFPADSITVVNNSLGDEALRRGLESCRLIGRETIRKQLHCGAGPVAIYCGRLSEIKRIDFLLAAAQRLRSLMSSFELLIVGDGPERYRVEEAMLKHSWIHYGGSVVDERRAQYWFAADIALMPGAVGLVIVDSFVAECPLVTTLSSLHGPEIAYLEPGRNGIATRDSMDAYIDEVASILCDPQRLRRLQAGCRESAARYSLDRMTDNFVAGTLACLNATRQRMGWVTP